MGCMYLGVLPWLTKLLVNCLIAAELSFGVVLAMLRGSGVTKVCVGV